MEKEVIAEKVNFTQAAPHMVKSLGCDVEVLKKECDSGVSQCWRMQNGEAYMLTRAENKELVICCFEGKNLSEIISGVIKAAKNSGFISIRFHTNRPAIIKLIKEEFYYEEHIFKRVL